jgi:hypothetical protein
VKQDALKLIALNAGYLVAGVGILLAIGAARDRRELVLRVGLAYVLGIVAVGMLAAHLSLIGQFPGRIGVAVLDVLFLAAGIARVRLRPPPPRRVDPQAPRRLRPTLLITAGALLVTGVQLVSDARAFAVDALRDWDAWNIWTLKARVLELGGDAASPAMTSHAYQLSHLDYPLLLPSVEALALRGAGGFDVTVIKLQLLLLLAGFGLAAIGLVADRTPSETVAVAVLALSTSPWILDQLRSGYADVPLALLVTLGVMALARYLADGEPWALAAAALLLAGSGLTKNEGLWFAASGYACAVVVVAISARHRLLPLVASGVAALALVAPWRLWVAVHGLPSNDYHVSDALSPSFLIGRWSRVDPTVHDLWHEVGLNTWGSAGTLLIIGLVAGVLAGRLALVAFSVGWLLLSFAGLIVIYWISLLDLSFHLALSANRVVTTLVIGGTLLASVLAGEAWRAAESPERLAVVRPARGSDRAAPAQP